MFMRSLIILFTALSLAGCGGGGLFGKIKLGKSAETSQVPTAGEEKRDTIWDLFANADDPNVTIAVNKYIWNATLDVLSFLPVEAADPFSGVIVMGWGRANGSGRQYRATVYIQDPALDARSLRVALVTGNGAASKDTIRAIEDAILTRARQMRIADGNL